MRALFFPNLDQEQAGKEFSVQGETLHHLLRVVRLNENEDVLILDGKGRIGSGRVASVTKKSLSIYLESKIHAERKHSIALAFGMIKPDAAADLIKMAVELGVSDLYPLKTTYSQKLSIKGERVDRLMESALLQSNNPYLPVFHEEMTLRESLALIEDKVGVLFSNRGERPVEPKYPVDKSYLLFIGPEGGFSEEEERLLDEQGVIKVQLQTPILRAPTAACAGIGYLLSKIGIME